MSKKTSTPTQVQYRSSVKGTFISQKQAERSPRTSEREVIKHPERKK